MSTMTTEAPIEPKREEAAPTPEQMAAHETAQKQVDALFNEMVGLAPAPSEKQEAPAQTPEQPTATPVADPLQEKPAEPAKDHPLLALATGNADTKVEVPDAVKSWMEELKMGDPETLLKEWSGFRDQRAKLEAEVKKAQNDLAFVGKLSAEARNVLQMDLDGKDWKKEVIEKRPHHIDFSHPFEKQDPKQLLKAYADGKVTEEQLEVYLDKDIDDTDPDKRYVGAVLDGVKHLYDRDSNEAMTYVERTAKEEQERQARTAAAHEASLKHVLSSVPGAEAYKDEITSAGDSLFDEFYNEDGTKKLDFHRKAWMLKNMDMLLSAYKERVKVEAGEDAHLEVIRRQPDVGQANKRGSSTTPTTNGEDQAREFVKKELGYAWF